MNPILASGLVERIGEAEGLIKCTMRPGSKDEMVVKNTLLLPIIRAA